MSNFISPICQVLTNTYMINNLTHDKPIELSPKEMAAVCSTYKSKEAIMIIIALLEGADVCHRDHSWDYCTFETARRKLNYALYGRPW